MRAPARWLAVLAASTLLAGAASAHEVRPAYLELTEVDGETYDVLWKVPARGDDQRLGLYLRLPDGARLVAPPRATMTGNSYLERSRILRPGGWTGCEFFVEGLTATMTDVLARIERSDGTTQVARLVPARPSFVVEAVPGLVRVARTYLELGVEHILLGIDHLLFLLALLLLVSGWRRLVATVTAFSVSHCATLTLASLGYLRLPGRPVEAAIALSIVFVSAEILQRRHGRSGLALRWPWSVSFAFGLLHGLGFAGALHEVGLPQRDIPLALASFSLGVELGQLAFVAVVLVALAAGRRALVALRARTDLPLLEPAALETAAAYAIGSVAAFWLVERTATFFA